MPDLDIPQTKYLPFCALYLPDFPITHIGFGPSYARKFFRIPGSSFTMLHQILIGPIGAKFLHKAQSAKRPVLAWTVNERDRMRWCIRNRLDGVITDDPKAFLEECQAFDSAEEPVAIDLSINTVINIIRIHVMVFAYGLVFAWKYREELI